MGECPLLTQADNTPAWNVDAIVTVLMGISSWSFVMSEYRPAYNDAFLHDCMRIHQQWHERAKSRDTEGLLALYAKETVLETPLVQAIFDWPREWHPPGAPRDSSFL